MYHLSVEVSLKHFISMEVSMKNFYEAPEFEFVTFESEDVITVSLGFGDNDFDIGDTDWD